jgi:peptidyl-prolyl cis-trans isomerase C
MLFDKEKSGKLIGILKVSLIATLLFTFSCDRIKKAKTEKKKEEGETMVKIGDIRVSIEDFKGFLDSLPETRKIELARSPEKVTQLVAEFIEAVAVFAYSKSQGYFDRPEIKVRWIYNSAEIVRPYLFNEKIKPYLQVNFPEIQEFYEKNKEMFKHPDVIRLMKIEADSKAEIEEIRKKIKNIQDFINIAQKRHLPAEFDYGYVDRNYINDRLKEVSRIILSLKAGEISQPVKFNNKYTIFAVVDKLEEGYWELEKVIDQVFKAVREKKIRDSINNIVKEIGTTMDFYVNFDAIEKKLGVKIQKDKFEELFMERYK